jgi:hypothetical protein
MAHQSESNFYHTFTLYWSIEAVVAVKRHTLAHLHKIFRLKAFSVAVPEAIASGISKITLGHL